MTPSEAMIAYQQAEIDADAWHLTPEQTKAMLADAAADIDQAIYDMARRAHLGLPMAGPSRPKRHG